MGAQVTKKKRSKGSVAMRSPVAWALLGLVIEHTSYGYELLQRFERTYGEVLELSSPSQIYVSLDTLVGNGMIEKLPLDPDASVERQPKPHYRATALGLEEYQEWLLAQMRSEHRPSRLFVRRLASLEPKQALAVIARYEQVCLGEARQAAGAAEGSADEVAFRLAREEERLTVGVRLAWIDYARRELTAEARRARRR